MTKQKQGQEERGEWGPRNTVDTVDGVPVVQEEPASAEVATEPAAESDDEQES